MAEIWDFSDPTVTFDNPEFTFDGILPLPPPVQPPPIILPPLPPVLVPGNQPDIVNRLKRLQPPGWFAEGATPIRDALLTGIANALAFVFSLFTYLKLQTRIATMTDGFLDMTAGDYFGDNLQREVNQSDASYRSRIQAELLPLKNTRQAIIDALTLITGRVPIVFEPGRIQDAGAYNAGTLAYNTAGGYGSMQYPFQCFVVAFRPLGSGIPNIAGYGDSFGAYNTPSQASYVSLSQIIGQITDADIYAAVEGVRTGATIVWMRISS
jgi:hypothetical protein